MNEILCIFFLQWISHVNPLSASAVTITAVSTATNFATQWMTVEMEQMKNRSIVSTD